MTHKSTVRVKTAIKKARLDKAELLALLRFLLAMIQTTKGKTRLSKAQRKSLAITERQLGVRLSRKGTGGHRRASRKHHLGPGIHRVRLGKHLRRVRVLPNGKWMFLKG